MLSIKYWLYLVLLAILFPIFVAGTSARADETVAAAVPEKWANTYTAEELAAIDRALWAANLTREDLSFKKDYARGYQSLPIILDWLKNPMDIAPGMDSMIADITEWENVAPSPFSELAQSLTYFPGQDKSTVEAIFSGKPGARDLSLMDSDGLKTLLTDMAISTVNLPFEPEEMDIIRQYAPYQMAWHDIFESPYTEDQIKAWDEMQKDKPADYLYAMMSRSDFGSLVAQYLKLCPDPRGLFDTIPKDAWPRWTPVIIETDGGRIGIGSRHDDVWKGDFTMLIDPGGNDHYINCRIGAAYGTEGKRFGYFVDMGGDDVYDCGETNITLGASILGVAAFYDLGQGNDRYTSGSCTLGATICGIATFYDDGGSDIYEGKVYTQGAAGFGIGLMLDESMQEMPVVPTDVETPEPINIALFDNDYYYAWVNSQAFARTLGIAVCSNQRGNETYNAGGVYLDAPLFSDRYQSFSQGFAIGERGIDYAGGIALIVDYSGNDLYLGDVYNQGVGYWYSAGFVYDGAGNDMYEMTQYGQGSGIHLAIGGLIDVSGSDSYMMHSGLGVGGSHDFAASVLHDRAGNDRYFGNTSCNGGALTNSAVIFIDRSGDDTYAGRRNGGINFGRPERGFTSIGILVDLSGNDDYLGIMDNGKLWLQDQTGIGWDVTPPPTPEGEAPGAPGLPDQPGANVVQPEIIAYEGELTQEVFDELWEIATRWEVGDNRYIVPHAIDRLIAFGPPLLPYLSEEFKDDRSGLALRAFSPILKAIAEQDRAGVLDIIRENLETTDEIRMRVAMAEITDLKASELEGDVAKLLDEPDPYMQRRAIGVLGSIGSHVADEKLLANLNPSYDEALIKVSLDNLFTLDVRAWDLIRPLLEYPTITVREDLIGKLVANPGMYVTELKRELVNSTIPAFGSETPDALSVRALRSVLKVFSKAEIVPDQDCVNSISILLENSDWGVRADAVLVVKHWMEMSIEPEPEETTEEATTGETVTEEAPVI
ncbi:MAG: HEAT repeat domain-containing protein, partial [bacterium]